MSEGGHGGIYYHDYYIINYFEVQVCYSLSRDCNTCESVNQP